MIELGERFWSKVDKNAVGGCWNWTAGRSKYGYGNYSIDGRMWRAHRASAAASGLNVENMCVCHRCDNTSCVNPSHLFVGTQADNVADRVAKGRCRPAPKGVLHGRAKLTVPRVVEMRRLFDAGGVTKVALARQFDVTGPTVWKVVTRKSWRHVA